jgi:general secretion pathway protein D
MRFPARAAGVAAFALLLAGGAFAAEDPPKPAEAPTPAPAPAPAPEKPKDEVGISLAEDRVTAPQGWVVWYYSVNFVDPGILKTELERWKTPEAKVEAMTTISPRPNEPAPSANILRIQERKENLPLLEKMLEVLDQPQPQVLVKAKLVEVTYSGSLEWGIADTYTAPGDTFFRGGSAIFNPDSFLNATPARPFQGGTAAFATVGDTQSRFGSLDMLIRLLKSKGKAEILGEPNILATQGQKARVKAGEKVPIQTANYQNSTLIVSTSFEDTGIELTILPELIGKDAVRLKLTESFSAVTGFVDGQGGTQNPVINRRDAETTLTVRDGATLVVGGLQSSRKIDQEKGIPILMDIPVLGWLFKSVSKEEVKTELYFIATPEIIRGSYAEGLIKPPGEKARLQRTER